MTAKHTEGDWWADGLEVGNDPVMSVKVAKVGGATYEEALANARLIAAAKVLLRTLKSAKWMLERDFIDDAKARVIAACDNAIEQAEGESK